MRKFILVLLVILFNMCGLAFCSPNNVDMDQNMQKHLLVKKRKPRQPPIQASPVAPEENFPKEESIIRNEEQTIVQESPVEPEEKFPNEEKVKSNGKQIIVQESPVVPEENFPNEENVVRNEEQIATQDISAREAKTEPMLLDIDKDRFFIAMTVPKSGTHLLKLALEEITDRKGWGPCHPINCISLVSDHFNNFSHFIITHTTDSFFNFVSERLPRDVKIILLIRDFRDMIISAVNFIDKNNVNMWVGFNQVINDEEWRQLSRKNKIALFIQLNDFAIEQEYLKNSLVSKKIVEGFPNVYLCRYENIVGSKGGGDDHLLYDELINLSNFLNVELSECKLRCLLCSLYGNKKSPTFMEGKIGNWKKEFDVDSKNLFKEKLGQTLIDWGYEVDNNW